MYTWIMYIRSNWKTALGTIRYDTIRYNATPVTVRMAGST